MNINWTARARANVSSIRTTLAETSPALATKIVARIVRKVDILVDHPLFGAVVYEYDDDDLRELFEQPYRVFYRVYPDRIDVVGVVHSARQLPSGL
jgi:toxin ParE1/3/4